MKKYATNVQKENKDRGPGTGTPEKQDCKNQDQKN